MHARLLPHDVRLDGPTWLAEGVAEMGNYWKEGELAVAADGSWKTGKAARPIDADGDDDGHGRLVGGILVSGERGFFLGEEIPLGRVTSFRAAATGRLYVRCADDWTQLSDNDGQITVTVSRQ